MLYMERPMVRRMNFENFLVGDERDFKGRTLNDIRSYTDHEIEHVHDFIQIVFPLNEESRASFHGYYLRHDLLVEQIRSNELAKTNIVKSAEWFLKFLERNSNWKAVYNHNHLRITRIIKCLRLLVSDQEADKFYNDVLHLLGHQSKINEVTLAFWENA